MHLGVWMIYFLCAIPLYFLLDYLKEKQDLTKKESKEENQTLQMMIEIVLPTIYIIVLAGIFASCNARWLLKNIYLIVVFECLIRFIMENYLKKRMGLFKVKSFMLLSLAKIVLAYLLYVNFISQVKNVFPNPENFKSEVWFLILLFLYSILKGKVALKKTEEEPGFAKRQEYIVMEYARFKNKYRKVVVNQIKEDFFIPLVYAIMIYENYMNPLFNRKIVEMKGNFSGKSVPRGIMQMPSKREIDDEKSIQMAITKLEKIYLKNNYPKKKQTKEIWLELLLKEYKKDADSQKGILEIYKILVEFDKSDS